MSDKREDGEKMKLVKFDGRNVFVVAQRLRSKAGTLREGVTVPDAKTLCIALDLSTHSMERAGAHSKTDKTRMRLAIVRERLESMLA